MSIGTFKKETSSSTPGASSKLVMQAEQTASFTAVAGNYYPIDTSGTTVGVAITPPASPSAGDQFGITDSNQSFTEDKPATFVPSLSTQNYASSSDILDSPNFQEPNQAAVFEYVDASIGWVLIAGSTNFKGREFPVFDPVIKTADFTAFRNTGYLVDTSGGAITATINNYAGSDDYDPKDKISFVDAARSFDTNDFTIDFDAFKFSGELGASLLIDEKDESLVFEYVDDTTGFVLVSGDIDPNSAGSGSSKHQIAFNAHRHSGLTNNRISLLDGTSGHQDHAMAQTVAPTLPLLVGSTQAMNDTRKWGAIIIGDDYDSLAIQVIVRNTSAIVADGDASVVLYHAPRSAFTDGTANLDMEVIAIKELDLQAANSSQMFSWALAGALTDSGIYGDGDFLFLTILNETGASAEFRWNYTIMGVKN